MWLQEESLEELLRRPRTCNPRRTQRRGSGERGRIAGRLWPGVRRAERRRGRRWWWGPMSAGGGAVGVVGRTAAGRPGEAADPCRD